MATQLNALKYIMEKRYRNYGDQFTRRWDDHLFLELGMAYNYDFHSGHDDLSPLTMSSLGVGKQFTPLHAARLNVGVGYGYYSNTKNNYMRLEASADWLFSLSTYMDGYRPSRALDVSAFFGGGVRYHDVTAYNAAIGHASGRVSGHLHGGLRMKFFTGPQGYLVLEPYAGVSSRWLDRKFGAFCGAHLGFLYYIHNNLSVEDRLRYMRKHAGTDEATLDAAQQYRAPNWRTPWFVELSGGVSLFQGTNSNAQAELGHATHIGVGRWFSPVIGLRTVMSHAYSTWQHTEVPVGEQDAERRQLLQIPAQPSQTWRQYNVNTDIRVEALVNPLGMLRSFSWNSPFGCSLVVGGGVGRLKKMQEQELRTTTSLYTAGLNLWCRLSDNLRLFVEPLFTSYNYRIPYNNIDRSERYSDNVYTLRVGVAANTCARSFRSVSDGDGSTWPSVSVGLTGGTSLPYTFGSYKGNRFNYNAQIYGEWHLDRLSAVRVGFQMLHINGFGPHAYDVYDYDGQFKYSTTAMFRHSYMRGILSLGYLFDVNRLFSGIVPRRLFSLECFAGPAVMFAMSTKHEADGVLTGDADDQALASFADNKTVFGLNGGLKLRLNATPRLAVVLVPQLNLLFCDPQFDGVNMFNRVRGIESLDLGVQYSF